MISDTTTSTPAPQSNPPPPTPPTQLPSQTAHHHFIVPDPLAMSPQGDSHLNKQTNHIRFYFQNINGLKWGSNQFDITNKYHQLHSLDVNFFGLAETNLEFRNRSVLHRFHQLITNPFNKQISCSTSSSTVKFPAAWKPGGTTTTATGQWISRIIEKGEDPTGTGTWSYLKLRGKNQMKIVIITVYRLCNTTDAVAHGPETAYCQIYTVLQPPPNAKPKLRRRCDKLLQEQIQTWLDQQYEIILMADANESLRPTPKGFHKIMQNLNLHDPFTHIHPNLHPNFPTYFRGSNRIDFAYVTPNLLPYVRQCGYLTYHEGLDGGDHRGLFIDFDEHGIMGEQSPILPPTSCILKTNYANRASKYRKLLLHYMTDKHITERIKHLGQQLKFNPTNPSHQLCNDKIDNDLTRAMLAAEKRSGNTYPSMPWSPTLRDTGLRVRYWNARIQEINSSRSYASILEKISNQIHITDTGQSSLTYIYSQLRVAKATLALTKKNASSLRDTFLSDLATHYVATNRSPTHQQALNRIINAENHREVFQKIKHALNPIQHNGLSQLEVPNTSITSHDNLSPNPNLVTYPAQQLLTRGYQ